MGIGLLYAAAAGLMWGLVFVCPLLLPDYPAAWLSVGRYVAFGLIALPLAWWDRAALRGLTRWDWLQALKLAAVGNLLYYFFLASAIQRAGGALPAVIMATLPVVIALYANGRNARRDGLLPWRALLPALGLTGLGVACVHHGELQTLVRSGTTDPGRYGLGAALALGALLCWTWYPLRNADWLRQHPERAPRAWATAQGLATLPLALLGGAALGWGTASPMPGPLPLGPQPERFVGLMLAMGLFASWLGTLCWNEASQRLPTALAGQLIVFETLAALAYAFALRGSGPEPLTALGIGLLVAGVALGLAVQPRAPADATGLAGPARRPPASASEKPDR